MAYDALPALRYQVRVTLGQNIWHLMDLEIEDCRAKSLIWRVRLSYLILSPANISNLIQAFKGSLMFRVLSDKSFSRL